MMLDDITGPKNELLTDNSERTKNEQILYDKWKKTEREKSAMVQKLNQIQRQLINMQEKYNELEKKLVQNEDKSKVDYCTDEEELAKETEWIRAKSNRSKKRRMNTSPSPIQKTPPKKENSFPNNEKTKSRKSQIPPPVVVDGIQNFNGLHEELSKMMADYQIKIINDSNIKINVPDGEKYRKLTDMLNNNQFSWHSYENKQNRQIKVIAKKLHHACKPEKIVEHLKREGFKIIEATPKLKYKTKEPLNMFMLTFNNDENVNKIFEITNIMGIRVEIEPVKKSKLVPQCKRCQAYGHTQKYCAKEPRCVKCTGKHLTKDCSKAKDAHPKCIHCGEGHPANYRGCVVAKEIQKIKNNQTKKQELPQKPVRFYQQINSKINEQTGNKLPLTFSQVTAASADNADTNRKKTQKLTTDQTLELILEKLNKLEDRIIKLEYSNKGAIPKQLKWVQTS